MVKPFQDAVFSRTRAGLIPRIVESDFGFHLIYVTQPKTKRSYVVTSIFKEIIPSDNTRNNIYRNAEMFKIEAQTSNESFEILAEKKNYSVVSIENVDKNASVISSVPDARSVVLWAYDDQRDIDDISDVIELNNGYVVSLLSDIKKEGTKRLEDVEVSVRKSIIDQKKFEYFSELFTDYNTLDDLKSLYDGGEIDNMPELDFNTNSISNVGFAPEAIGVAFSMSDGELTRPIKIDDGIIVIQLNNLISSDTLQSYSDYGTAILQANKFTSSLKIDKAIKEFSNIEDLRYKFF